MRNAGSWKPDVGRSEVRKVQYSIVKYNIV